MDQITTQVPFAGTNIHLHIECHGRVGGKRTKWISTHIRCCRSNLIKGIGAVINAIYTKHLSNCKCGIHFIDTIGYTHLVTSTIISDETNIG